MEKHISGHYKIRYEVRVTEHNGVLKIYVHAEERRL